MRNRTAVLIFGLIGVVGHMLGAGHFDRSGDPEPQPRAAPQRPEAPYRMTPLERAIADRRPAEPRGAQAGRKDRVAGGEAPQVQQAQDGRVGRTAPVGGAVRGVPQGGIGRR